MPDFFLKFRTGLNGRTIEPGEDAMEIILHDFNNYLPAEAWPTEIDIVGGYREWASLESFLWLPVETNFTPFDYRTGFKANPELILYIDGARTITVQGLKNTIRLGRLVHDIDIDFLLNWTVRIELSGGHEWDLHNLDVYLALFIDPEGRVREGDSDCCGGTSGEENNIHLFRWFGADRPKTRGEIEFPPGFYFLGLWNPRSET